MAGGRNSQPLFNFLRSRESVNTPAARRAQMNPGVGWRPDGAVTPTEAELRERAAAPARLEVKPVRQAAAREHLTDSTPISEDILLAGGRLRLPKYVVWLTIAVIVLAVVAAYIIGARFGDSDAQPRITPPVLEPSDGVTRAEASPSSPDGTDARPAGGAGQVSSSDNVKPLPRQARDAAVLVPPAGAVALTAKGWLPSDPRQDGLNYLLLASFNLTEAEDAVVFLSENGLETFALYVDPSRIRGNNPDPTRPFRLFASRGITSDEYSKKMTARTGIEGQVARLGPRWQKERKGSSNFAKPDWQKYSR
jgi:hypothetical protein